MTLLSSPELRRFEKHYAQGISSAVIVELFQGKGERFSEPTLRKYVQLGLLPRSRRVGIRGRHKGSSGLYPVVVVELINEIKKALDAGATLEEIRVGKVGLIGELEMLQRASEQVTGRFGEAIKRQPVAKRRRLLQRRLDKHRRSLAREVRELGKFALQLGRTGGQ